jgi:CheY-like chemotaxis protein
MHDVSRAGPLPVNRPLPPRLRNSACGQHLLSLSSNYPQEVAPPRGLRLNARVRNPPPPQPDQEALVVEDDPDARWLVAACLRRLGLRVHEAASGAEAKILLERAIPDLICLDLRLPDASGLTLCEHIRATPRLRDIPVVVITALTRPIDRAQAEYAGADEYMTKPFRADALVDSVRELMALASVAAS